MAQFRVDGRYFTASRELFKPKISTASDFVLEYDLNNLMQLEQDFEQGLLECSAPDWDEIKGIAVDIVNELGVRQLLRSCGITLEVG